MVGEQVVDVDEAADRILKCKTGIAEAIRDQKWVDGFRTQCFCTDNKLWLPRVWLNDNVRLMHCAQEFLFCSYFCWVVYVLITLTIRQDLLCTVHTSNLFQTERTVCICGYTYLFQHLSIEALGVHAWFCFSVEFIYCSTCNGRFFKK